MDKGNMVRMLLLDLPNAFDTVDHSIFTYETSIIIY